MRTKTIEISDPKIQYAAQNAREGLINVLDLSLLTGVPVAQLTSFAKKGLIRFEGEYQGKRFYNFEEIVTWVNAPTDENEAKTFVRQTMESVLRRKDCPYAIDRTDGPDGSPTLRIVWKDAA